MQMYVNQHDFFISQDRFLQESEQATGYQLEGDAEPSKDDERADMYVESPSSGFVEAKLRYCCSRWKSLNDPNIPAPSREPGLEALFNEIRTTVGQEAQIIAAVFPDKEEVMKVFLQRVFAQVVCASCDCSGSPF